MKPNRAMIIYGTFHISNISMNEEWYPLFNDEVKRNIKEGKAVAATNASVKNGQMGESWVMSNMNKRELLSNQLYHKHQINNMAGIAEVIMLLELITVIERKGRGIEEGKIVIGIDNKKAYRKIVNEIKKSNKYTQEAGAEIAMIKRVIKKINFKVEILLVREYENDIGMY